MTSSPFKVDTPYSIIGLNAAKLPSTPPNPCAEIKDMVPETSASSFGTVISFGESKYNCKKPRNQRKKKDVKFTNIQEQLDFSQAKYGKVVDKYMNTPCSCITKKMQDDVWSWGLFSEVVLPMLTFIDE